MVWIPPPSQNHCSLNTLVGGQPLPCPIHKEKSLRPEEKFDLKNGTNWENLKNRHPWKHGNGWWGFRGIPYSPDPRVVRLCKNLFPARNKKTTTKNEENTRILSKPRNAKEIKEANSKVQKMCSEFASHSHAPGGSKRKGGRRLSTVF